VPETLRAAWLGHTVAVNRSAYLGAPQPGELAAISEALGDIFKACEPWRLINLSRGIILVDLRVLPEPRCHTLPPHRTRAGS
jgi:hypothetical protein